jgi:hypothetical protein
MRKQDQRLTGVQNGTDLGWAARRHIRVKKKDNDDVYIEYYGDGYYLYNRRYPQERIAVIVSVN